MRDRSRIAAMARSHCRRFRDEVAEHGFPIAVNALALFVAGLEPRDRKAFAESLAMLDATKAAARAAAGGLPS
mgnify:FL=1